RGAGPHRRHTRHRGAAHRRYAGSEQLLDQVPARLRRGVRLSRLVGVRAAGARRSMKLKPWFIVLLIVAVAGFAYAPQLILGAPREATMGTVQKIFYFHVQVAWLTFLAAFICAGGSIAYLFKNSQRGDALAAATAEMTVLFGLCALVTGPLW